MQTGLQAEALLCPNCKEEVPKTLYCLNCGYPLYKIEVESEPAVEEDAPEPVAIVEAEPVEEEAVEVAPEPQVIIEPEVVQEEIVAITPEPQAHIEPEVVQEEIVEIAPEPPAPIVVVEEEVVKTALEPVAVVEAEPVEEDVVVLVDSVEEFEVPVEVVAEPEVVEPVVEEIIDFELAIEPVADVNAEVEAPVAEAILVAEEPEPVEAEEVLEPVVEVEPEVVAVPEYEPDPVIREVMGNLAKNISMKIKLVDLLRTGGVKSEIFRKLFDSYLIRGELLMNSRSDMLERVRYDLGSMEGALHEAREGLEELDIRRAIEDVSEEEYAAKAPGFQWDIGQYKDEVGKKKADIYYLEDITRVMSSEEIGELVGLGEGCFEVLDELTESEGIDGDAAARIRVSLEEALACIR